MAKKGEVKFKRKSEEADETPQYNKRREIWGLPYFKDAQSLRQCCQCYLQFKAVCDLKADTQVRLDNSESNEVAFGVIQFILGRNYQERLLAGHMVVIRQQLSELFPGEPATTWYREGMGRGHAGGKLDSIYRRNTEFLRSNGLRGLTREKRVELQNHPGPIGGDEFDQKRLEVFREGLVGWDSREEEQIAEPVEDPLTFIVKMEPEVGEPEQEKELPAPPAERETVRNEVAAIPPQQPRREAAKPTERFKPNEIMQLMDDVRTGLRECSNRDDQFWFVVKLTTKYLYDYEFERSSE